VASVDACRDALLHLGETLAAVDPELRERHVPRRTLGCCLTDLDTAFTGRIDPDGLHEVEQADVTAVAGCDVRASCTSEELLALSAGEDTIVNAWLHGRLHISASVRDVLRLRSLIGL
jgi:hypothetical protein